MRTPVLPLMVCAYALMTNPATADPAKPSSPAEKTTTTIRLDLTLTDGSLIKGTPASNHESLSLRTAFGDVSIPLATIQKLVVADDQETFVVSFANGDRITGFVRTQDVRVSAVLGQLKVPWSVVRSCQVQKVITTTARSAPTIRAIGVRASGAYGSQKPAMAIDGKTGTSWSSGAWGGWLELDLGAVYELGDIRVNLQFSPAGAATHEVYVSDSPIAGKTNGARLLKRFTGTRRNGDVLAVACPPGTCARYVQVRCPSSRSWFNIKEITVSPRTTARAS